MRSEFLKVNKQVKVNAREASTVLVTRKTEVIGPHRLWKRDKSSEGSLDGL
jgi:hypothetical protein